MMRRIPSCLPAIAFVALMGMTLLLLTALLDPQISDNTGDTPADEPARNPAALQQIEQLIDVLKEDGYIEEIRHEDPVVAIVNERYLALGGRRETVEYYDGHWVGIVAEYVWQRHGHHRVTVVLTNGEVIGRKTASFPDDRLVQVYRKNVSQMMGATSLAAP